MLHFLVGSDRLILEDMIISRVSEAVANQRPGQVLIVPERFTHETEMRLCREAGSTTSRFAEVLSFSRMCNRVAMDFGGISRISMDHGGCLLNMVRSAEQVVSNIKYFAPAIRKPAFLQQAVAIVNELQSYCISPEMLFNASQKGSGQFSQKLNELGMLYHTYLAFCATGPIDPAGNLSWLAEKLQEDDWAATRTFYIHGFTDFTAAEYAVIDALLCYGKNVWISLTSRMESDLLAGPIVKTQRKLEKIAEQRDIPINIQICSTLYNRTPELQRILSRMFSAQTVSQHGGSETVTLGTFSSVEEECKQAAFKIKHLLCSGSRCKEIAVACTDIDRYKPVLLSVLQEAEIPFHVSEEGKVLAKPLIFDLITTLYASVGPMNYRDIAQYLKSDIHGLDSNMCDLLDNYAYLWNIHGKQWENPFSLHPSGIGFLWDPISKKQLKKLEEYRQIAIEPLLHLRKHLFSAACTGDMVLAVYHYMEELQLPERLEKMANSVSGQARQELVQLYDILCDSLEQMWAVLGETVRTPEDFVSLYRTLLMQYSVNTIPAGLDEIIIGEPDQLRYKKVKHLLVLGAEDGCFPQYNCSDGILTEKERNLLFAQGIVLSPSKGDQIDYQMCRIFYMLSAATETLWISFAGDRPSWIFRRASVLFPDCVVTKWENVFLGPRSLASWHLRNNDSFCADSELGSWEKRLFELKNYDFSNLDRYTISGLYGSSIRLSASKIDKFVSCRFAFFAEYGLNAMPRKQAALNPSAYGSFVHAVLEKTVRRVIEEGGFRSIIPDRLYKIAEEEICTCGADLYPVFSDRDRFYYDRSCFEILKIVQDLGEELRCSLFQPVSCELSFSEKKGGLPPIIIEGKNGLCTLSGFVDRVDLYEKNGQHYVRIIDYKTGKKDFSYTDLLIGSGMQMLIYLFALKQHGASYYGLSNPLVPAGVLYMPARIEFIPIENGTDKDQITEERMKSLERKGVVRDDLLDAMEADPESPRFMPYSLNKDGSRKDTINHAQMNMLEEFVNKKLREVVEEIWSGSIIPNPIVKGEKTSCTYCAYESLCHKNLCTSENRAIAKTKSDLFWEKLYEMR